MISLKHFSRKNLDGIPNRTLQPKPNHNTDDEKQTRIFATKMNKPLQEKQQQKY